MPCEDFKYSEPEINAESINQFTGTPSEKQMFSSLLYEWNSRRSISEMCVSWSKERRETSIENLIIVLWNCEGLRTHGHDLDELLSSHKPHLCILTGVGSQIRKLPAIPNYYWQSQEGTNSFGGVAILIHHKLKSSVIDREENCLLIELELLNNKLLLGAVYVPPRSYPPFTFLDKHKEKDTFLFGNFNAKDVNWLCERNNSCGNSLNRWIEKEGLQVLHPTGTTSRRSDTIIDFGIGKDFSGWKLSTLDEGNSDHFPLLISTPLCAGKNGFFRKTEWNVFRAFLNAAHKYWNALVYNIDHNAFFELFSNFLAALYDRCSSYEEIKCFRPPWPTHLVILAQTVNKCKRKFRRTRFLGDYQDFLDVRKLFVNEKRLFAQRRTEEKLINMKEGNNIWSHVKNTFTPYTPPFRGLKVGQIILRNDQESVNHLADYYEEHYAAPNFDVSNRFHVECLNEYEEIGNRENIALGQINYDEVLKHWKSFKPKKSLDSTRTSAFLLKELPLQYLNTITVLFNKSAHKGAFFTRGKEAKGICHTQRRSASIRGPPQIHFAPTQPGKVFRENNSR